MHPRREELLMLLDRAPIDQRVTDHVQQCSQCAAELATIRRTRDALRALPPLQPPQQAWERVRLAMSEEERSPQRSRATRARSWAIALASAAGVAAVALTLASTLGLLNVAPDRSSETAAARLEPSELRADVPSDDLVYLMQQSRELEAALQALPARPHVERVSMAATLDTIEARIQWLDSQLTYAGEELDDAQAQRLWSERVELMDSLVKVRYAQTGHAVL